LLDRPGLGHDLRAIDSLAFNARRDQKRIAANRLLPSSMSFRSRLATYASEGRRHGDWIPIGINLQQLETGIADARMRGGRPARSGRDRGYVGLAGPGMRAT
jgi:hypothetical protein